MFSTVSLTVIPDNDTVLMCGLLSDGNNPQKLTGRLIVKSRSQLNLKTLSVTMRAKTSKLFEHTASAAPYIQYKSQLIENGEQIHIPASNNRFVTQKKTSRGFEQEWQFSIDVPGTTPETVFTRDAFVSYELIGELQTYSLFFPKAVSPAVPIIVKRTPEPNSSWYAVLHNAMEVSAKWRNTVELRGAAQSRVIHDKSTFRLHSVISPLVKGARVMRVGVQLRETTKHMLGDLLHVSSSSSIITQCSRELVPETFDKCVDGINVSTAFKPEWVDELGISGVWIDQDFVISADLDIPEAYKHIQYDVIQGPVLVSHEVVFVVTLSDVSGKMHTVRMTADVHVLPSTSDCCCPGENLLTSPPRYEDVDSDVLLAANIMAKDGGCRESGCFPDSFEDCYSSLVIDFDIPAAEYSCNEAQTPAVVSLPPPPPPQNYLTSALSGSRLFEYTVY